MHIDQLPTTEQTCCKQLQAAAAEHEEGYRELVYQNRQTGEYQRLRELAEYQIDEDEVQYLYPGTGYEVSSSDSPDFGGAVPQALGTLSEAYREWAKRSTAG